MPYRSEQRETVGGPVLPALVVDGVVHSLNHPVQVASLLGLEVAAAGDPVRLGWDLDRVLEAWLEALTLVPWRAVLEPTPSRGRATLELAVNTFVPVRLLPEAIRTGRFGWPGNPVTGELGDEAMRDHDREVEAGIAGPAAWTAFAAPIRAAWAELLLDEQAVRAERAVETPAGTLGVADLLDAQRLHAAQHLRQVTRHLAARGHPVPAFDPESLAGLRLPAQIY